ncbi:MAG TPA: hypothetical protein VGH58_05165 [Solirubrobacterales bacterium]|jgi:hypothetical protein
MLDWTEDTIRRLRDVLNRVVFLPSPPETLRLKGWEGGVVLLAFLALAVILQLLRIGPSSALNSLWAEDGPVFLEKAMTHDFLSVLTTPWSEYLVVTQSLIGEIGTLAPLRDAPAVMNLAAALVAALSGLAIWFASAAHIRSPYLRALLVALTVLVPVGSLETVASPTNVSWYMAVAVFWLLLWRPATTLGTSLSAGLILLTGFSTPVTFFFVPIAILRAVAIRDRRDALIVGAFALPTAVQVLTVLNSPHISSNVWTGGIITTFLQRVISGSVLGLELSGSLWTDWGWPFLIAITAVVTACLIVLALRASSSRLFAAIAIATSVVMFLVSSYQRGLGGMAWPVGAYGTIGARYTVVPTLLLIGAALALIDARRRSSRGRPVMEMATIAVLLVPLITSFDVGAGDARGGPPWEESLKAAAGSCEVRHLAEIPVYTAPAGWTMNISCDRLIGGQSP